MIVYFISIFLLLPGIARADWKVQFLSTLGTLTPEVRDSFSSIMWMFHALSLVLCFVLALCASKSLSNNDFGSGFKIFIAALVSGAAPMIARVFIY